MEYAFSIIMFIFGGALLLYSGILALTKDYNLIARGHATKPKDKKRYALCFARTMAIVALSPIITGLAGLTGNVIITAAAGVVSFVLCIFIGVKTFKPE
jgi:threonine/homoserine/homoserine lactone efflux protein